MICWILLSLTCAFAKRFPTRVPDVHAEERTREWFREACIRQHGSVVRAWKVMDLNCHARLTYYEFARGCQQLEIRNARRVWCALGRTGFITLQDIDAKLGEQLAMLAGLIGCTLGSIEKAWRRVRDGWGWLGDRVPN